MESVCSRKVSLKDNGSLWLPYLLVWTGDCRLPGMNAIRLHGHLARMAHGDSHRPVYVHLL